MIGIIYINAFKLVNKLTIIQYVSNQREIVLHFSHYLGYIKMSKCK